MRGVLEGDREVEEQGEDVRGEKCVAGAVVPAVRAERAATKGDSARDGK